MWFNASSSVAEALNSCAGATLEGNNASSSPRELDSTRSLPSRSRLALCILYSYPFCLVVFPDAAVMDFAGIMQPGNAIDDRLQRKPIQLCKKLIHYKLIVTLS